MFSVCRFGWLMDQLEQRPSIQVRPRLSRWRDTVMSNSQVLDDLCSPLIHPVQRNPVMNILTIRLARFRRWRRILMTLNQKLLHISGPRFFLDPDWQDPLLNILTMRLTCWWVARLNVFTLEYSLVTNWHWYIPANYLSDNIYVGFPIYFYNLINHPGSGLSTYILG